MNRRSTDFSGSCYETDLLLNLQMIVDDLEDEYTITYLHSRTRAQTLVGAGIYYGQKDLNPSLVYIARAEIFDRYPIQDAAVCRVCAGAPRRDWDPEAAVIELRDGSDWEEVFNRVQSLFLHYNSFSCQLYHILNNQGGLLELFRAAMDFFQNPLYAHDENFNIMVLPRRVVGMSTFVVDEATGNLRLTQEKITQFKQFEPYIQTLTTHGAQLWQPRYASARTVYVNLWDSTGRYRGRLLINELNSSLKPSVFTMAEYFAQIVVTFLEQERFRSSTALSFEHLLLQLLHGETVDPRYLQDRLRMVGWQLEHNYICFLTELSDQDRGTVTGKNITSAISVLLEGSFSIPLDNRVLTVCNLELAGYTRRNYWQKMGYLADSLSAVVGVSRPFNDLRKLGAYQRQAAKAIELGRNKYPERNYYPFQNFVLDYVVRHFTQEFEAEMVCSQAIMNLAEHDRERDTDYLRTLKAYFDCGKQQTATAQALFIHRSTLLYRLDKIREITGSDLDDPDTCLYFQISMRLLEE